MDRDAVLSAYDRERQELEVAGFRRFATEQLVLHEPLAPGTPGATALGAGFVTYSAHAPVAIEAAIDQVVARFSALQCEFEWKVFEHDRPEDLAARLARRGFDIGEAEELLILPVASARHLIDAASVHRVERITDPAQLADFLTVAAAVWPDKLAHAAWVEQQLRDEPDQIAVYVGYLGDEPVASARASFPRGSAFAGLWTGATLPLHRRKGLYTELVRARARDAAQRGYDYLMVDALPTSAKTLTRLGFQRVSASRPCMWRPL